jgi:lipopolysaccharide biosynthesis regulator YciM
MLTELLIVILVISALLIIYYYTREYRKPKKDKNNYLEALEYLVDGHEKRAIQKFKEAVRENSENIEAYLRLGDLLRKRGMAGNALKIHKDLMLRSNLSEDNRTKIQYSLMLDYENLGNTRLAIETAKSILEDGKAYQNETATRLLNYLETEALWMEARQTIKRYFRDIPAQLIKKSALYLVFEGMQLQENGEGRDARIKYKEAIKIDPACEAAYYYLGQSYFNENRLDDAIREWENLSEQIPRKAYVAFDALERTWFDLGRFTEAEKLYRSILEQDSGNLFAALALARIYEKKEDYDNALIILEHLNDENQLEPRIVGYKIRLLNNKNQYKQASGLALDYFQSDADIEDVEFICQECHYRSREPLWLCPQCKSINTFVE